MRSDEFIDDINITVKKNSVDSVLSNITTPPGRRPKQNLVSISNWFNSLTESEKQIIKSIIEESVDTTIFGFLCVIDGVRAIDQAHPKGKLHLFYEATNQKILLNPEGGEYLHDLFLSKLND